MKKQKQLKFVWQPSSTRIMPSSNLTAVTIGEDAQSSLLGKMVIGATIGGIIGRLLV